MQELYAGMDLEYWLDVAVISEFALHSLPICQLLHWPALEELDSFALKSFLINCVSFEAAPQRNRYRTETMVLLNYILPEKGVMSMVARQTTQLAIWKKQRCFSAYRKRIKPRFLRTQTRSLLEMMNSRGTARGTFNFEVEYMQKLLI